MRRAAALLTALLISLLLAPGAAAGTTAAQRGHGPQPAGVQPTRTRPVSPDTAPAPLTVVWPLVAEPVRLPTAPGEPALLRSDAAGTDPLLEQLAPGGRLDALVSALAELRPNGPLAGAVCVAIDPALLDTVSAMTGGYRVRTPAGPVPGTGQDEARRWLARLRVAVDGQCVLALPYADPDLVALSRAGLTDLQALARRTGTRVVQRVLGVTPLTGLAWPAGGVLDQRTLADLVALGTRAVLIEPRALRRQPGEAVGSVPLGSGAPRSGRTAPRGLLVDPLLQRARQPPRQPLLLVPPRRWQVTEPEATTLLRTARQLVTTGQFTPRALPALLDTSPGGSTATLDDPDTPQLPPAVTTQVATIRNTLRDLRVAMRRDPAVDLKPSALLNPLRLGLLRAVSTAWRDEPRQAAVRVNTVRDELAALRASVRIVPPSGPYTLTSSESPLLVTVKNELPVAVAVKVHINPIAGLSTGPPTVATVPARSTRQLLIPAQVERAGQFSTAVRLTTPGGTPLGAPTTLQLRSGAFDAVTVAITGGAGAVLVALVGLRLYRRFRARRAAEAGQG